MVSYDVTSIGEGGIRLSSPLGHRIQRARTFGIQIAGTEANVLCALGSLNWNTSWFSALPDSALGRRVEFQYKGFGVDLSHVKRVPGARIGTYYVEYSKPPLPTKVMFDRANTAFCNMTVDDVDWDALLDTRLLLLSGLTLPLSPTVRRVLEVANEKAHDAGVPVAFDVNYRHNLWEVEEAAKVVRPFIEQADILFCKRDDVNLLVKSVADEDEGLEALREISQASWIVMSNGAKGAEGLIDGKRMHEDAAPVEILDRLGAGDGLAAGVLHSWLNGNAEACLKYGVNVAGLALSHYGEQVTITVDELDSLVKNPHSSLER
ncbi:carbohydrate kinase, PfkB family [Bifidobacterium margollesii]|uniref:Carbohydrate kinase, PfkB family n=1 Tax=Bifidobacterium margollesii TaxID=2020964 RepID=A0A2N5JD28_9BIFI|nr:sugar kinase [Bifidobacterium margollesii]PLS32122.1 carbohydrate kinase, PfkB family [Bifidobacterium margollesii]